ncbi:MAG TPA: dihydrolipoamide acetyltransferase family protein [Acidimicrobiales bacterium]|jgi:pyruvate dehydrogenase E2 component (dihydrolipoamide acetyltransferase)
MTDRRTFELPDLGEGLIEAELVRWHVATGDEIVLNQTLAEVETEKAVVELPSPFAGQVAELLVEEGTTVAVGAPIISITVAAGTEMASGGERTAMLVGYGPSHAAPSRRHRATSKKSSDVEAPVMAKPPVRYLARQLGVDLADVQGSGDDGLITREDVLARTGGSGPPVAVAPEMGGERETRTPIKGVRKLTAQAMVQSAFTAPHVTEFVTIDITPTMELLERLRSNVVFEKVRLTPLALLARATLLALRDNPSLNSSWDEARGEIVTKHYVNLGIAAATPRGLMVPNIKEAHRLGLRELAVALSELTEAAKEGKCGPAVLEGGTITITNIGVFGIDAGTPILNPGEAAILCFGAVRRRPWEYEGGIALRSVTTLGLSFDHRLVDGEQGSRFLADVARTLSDPTYLIALS